MTINIPNMTFQHCLVFAGKAWKLNATVYQSEHCLVCKYGSLKVLEHIFAPFYNDEEKNVQLTACVNVKNFFHPKCLGQTT
jgi:hypothetical protein